MTAAFVSVEGVEKTYRAPGRALRALDPTTFALGSGEFVSIVGPSGCGRSTVLMMQYMDLKTTVAVDSLFTNEFLS